jgi:hypothetical protein
MALSDEYLAKYRALADAERSIGHVVVIRLLDEIQRLKEVIEYLHSK